MLSKENGSTRAQTLLLLVVQQLLIKGAGDAFVGGFIAQYVKSVSDISPGVRVGLMI